MEKEILVPGKERISDRRCSDRDKTFSLITL